jgi:O-antigen/teichoic acid export membrane protein
MVRSTVTFLGIDATIALWSSLQVLLLSRMASETEVGLYSAAAQVLVPVGLLFLSAERTLFPVMCRRFDPSFRGLKQVSERAIALLLALALPISVGLFALADPALLLLYGKKEFLAAAPALRILVWGIALKSLTHVLGQVLLAGRRERVTLRIVAVNALVSLGLGLLLVGRFGPVGAALATLLAGVADAIQHYVPVSRLLAGISLGRLAWRPGVACLCMAGVLAAARDWGVFLSAAAAASAYAGALLVLVVRAGGGQGHKANPQITQIAQI